MPAATRDVLKAAVLDEPRLYLEEMQEVLAEKCFEDYSCKQIRKILIHSFGFTRKMIQTYAAQRETHVWLG